MRTDEEILARVEAVRAEDFFGTQQIDLLVRLPLDKAKKYLAPDANLEKWVQYPRDRESILQEMLKYMPFAWDKANNCRGLSAYCSIDHFTTWIWLLEDEINLPKYEYYGKPILRRICYFYGWDANQWDNGIRTNN